MVRKGVVDAVSGPFLASGAPLRPFLGGSVLVTSYLLPIFVRLITLFSFGARRLSAYVHSFFVRSPIYFLVILSSL